MDNDQIILTYKCCSLKKTDIDTLSDYQYLNDIIISFYYEILNEKYKSDDFVLLDPAVSMSIIVEENLDDINQCIFIPLQMDKKKFIFAPVNDNTKIAYQTGGSHWALNVIDVTNNKILYFDSMLSNINNARRFQKKLEKLFNKKFSFECPIEEHYQGNSYDCGMFVLGFTHVILEYLSSKKFDINSLPDVNFDELFNNSERTKQENMSKFRKEIKEIINNLIQKKK